MHRNACLSLQFSNTVVLKTCALFQEANLFIIFLLNKWYNWYLGMCTWARNIVKEYSNVCNLFQSLRL